eukprot:1316342-Amorphochlora_amoeboformis.AAC.1
MAPRRFISHGLFSPSEMTHLLLPHTAPLLLTRFPRISQYCRPLAQGMKRWSSHPCQSGSSGSSGSWGRRGLRGLRGRRGRWGRRGHRVVGVPVFEESRLTLAWSEDDMGAFPNWQGVRKVSSMPESAVDKEAY